MNEKRSLAEHLRQGWSDAKRKIMSTKPTNITIGFKVVCDPEYIRTRLNSMPLNHRMRDYLRGSELRDLNITSTELNLTRKVFRADEKYSRQYQKDLFSGFKRLGKATQKELLPYLPRNWISTVPRRVMTKSANPLRPR